MHMIVKACSRPAAGQNAATHAKRLSQIRLTSEAALCHTGFLETLSPNNQEIYTVFKGILEVPAQLQEICALTRCVPTTYAR